MTKRQKKTEECINELISPSGPTDEGGVENVSAVEETGLIAPEISTAVSPIPSGMDESQATEEWVVRMLMKNVEQAMAGEPVLDRKGEPTGEFKYEGQIANKSLELIAKIKGYYQDKQESHEDNSIEIIEVRRDA